MITKNNISALNSYRPIETGCAIMDGPTGQAIREKMRQQIHEITKTMQSLGNNHNDISREQSVVF